MEGYLEGTNILAYDHRYMKHKLTEHFGESIIISGAERLTDVISLRENTDVILRQYYGIMTVLSLSGDLIFIIFCIIYIL